MALDFEGSYHEVKFRKGLTSSPELLVWVASLHFRLRVYMGCLYTLLRLSFDVMPIGMRRGPSSRPLPIKYCSSKGPCVLLQGSRISCIYFFF